MSDVKHEVKEYKIVHPIFPSGEYEKVENKLLFLDWYIPLITLCVVFAVLKVFIYLPDEKRNNQ